MGSGGVGRLEGRKERGSNVDGWCWDLEGAGVAHAARTQSRNAFSTIWQTLKLGTPLLLEITR